MKAFLTLCIAAAMTLAITPAFAQGRGRDRGNDKGSPTKSNGNENRGGPTTNGGTRRGVEGGGGRTYGDPGRGSTGRGSSDQGRANDKGRGDTGRGNNDRGGPGRDIDRGTGGQGRGDTGRGNNDRGGPGRDIDKGTGGQGRGDTGRGNNDRGGPGRDIDKGTGGQGRGDTGRGNNDRGNGQGSVGRGGSNSGGNRGNGNDDFGRGGNWNRGGTDGVTINSGSGSRTGNRGFDDALGRKPSRSGGDYKGSHNVSTETHIGGAVVIGRAPTHVRDITLRQQILRKDHPVLIRDGYRCGYYFYDSRWRDDYFWFGWYSFDPWSVRCVVSPWYYYPMLPPYVRWDRCRFYSFPAWSAWYGDPYQWQAPRYYGNYDYWGRQGSQIDDAVQDIVDSFQRADERAAGRIISPRSDVAIYIDGNYSYSLSADDFYDMFMDATQESKTIRYEILDVERRRNDDSVRVTARHTYEDPWGNRTSVTHYYELRREGRDYVISKFGVSGGK